MLKLVFFVLFWTLPIEESSVESQMKTFIPDEKCLILLQNIFGLAPNAKGYLPDYCSHLSADVVDWLCSLVRVSSLFIGSCAKL